MVKRRKANQMTDNIHGLVASVLALIMGIAVILCCAGCAVIKIHVQKGQDEYSGLGMSFFKDVTVNPMTFAADGSVKSDGYHSGVDGAAIGVAAGMAAKSLITP